MIEKNDQDEKLMLEAKNYYTSAIEIYSNLNMKHAVAEAKILLGKVLDYIG